MTTTNSKETAGNNHLIRQVSNSSVDDRPKLQIARSVLTQAASIDLWPYLNAHLTPSEITDLDIYKPLIYMDYLLP